MPTRSTPRDPASTAFLLVETAQERRPCLGGQVAQRRTARGLAVAWRRRWLARDARRRLEAASGPAGRRRADASSRRAGGWPTSSARWRSGAPRSCAASGARGRRQAARRSASSRTPGSSTSSSCATPSRRRCATTARCSPSPSAPYRRGRGRAVGRVMAAIGDLPAREVTTAHVEAHPHRARHGGRRRAERQQAPPDRWPRSSTSASGPSRRSTGA